MTFVFKLFNLVLHQYALNIILQIGPSPGEDLRLMHSANVDQFVLCTYLMLSILLPADDVFLGSKH